MSKIFLFFSMVILAGCSSTRYFRELNPAEKVALAQSRKQATLNDGCYHVLVMTDAGNMILKLYNETPLHRDNLVDKIKSGFYDSLIFHRVINNFVIQGGDPTSKRATGDAKVGEGEGPGPKIPAEFRTEQGIYHKRGALGMARDNNPEKASSNAQFYIVQRRAYRPAQLDSFVVQRNLTLSEAQRKLYTTQGGTPHLDGGYTVFGELESGWDVLDKIAAVKTGPGDRPVQDVRMRLFLLNEIKK